MDKQQLLLETIPCDKFDLLSKDEVVFLYKETHDLLKQAVKIIENTENKLLSNEQSNFLVKEQLFNIKNKLFGRSSEKSARGSKTKEKKVPKKRVRLPRERYKNLDIVEKQVSFDETPGCPCCSEKMQETELFDSCEYLTFIPRKYYVVREKRKKYRCKSCQGALVTTPAIPRVIPGGAYSDEMIIDVTLGKFLDLIPIERYTQIARRDGLVELPANSLITTTHKLADYIEGSYELIRKEVLESEVIHADETPHRMLEGDKKENWYVWGFSSDSASYFELRDTRSGDVASDLLVQSSCKYLMSDVYTGYQKAIREANDQRAEKILELNCNAHARRKFKESEKNFPGESEYFLRLYRKIYRLELQDYLENYPPWKRRYWQLQYMKMMMHQAQKDQLNHSKHSSIGKAYRYLLNNFEGLSRFTTDPSLPIDNNSQERQLRSPVVGRKTWYGTHSKRGAKTTAIMFSIVQSCKLVEVNPREYLKDLVRALHQGLPAYTPRQYLLRKESAN